MGKSKAVEREREIIAKLLEAMEMHLVRIRAQRDALEDLLTPSVAQLVVSQSEERWRPIFHEQLKPLFADILALPRPSDPPIDFEEIVRKLVESAEYPPLEP